MAETMMSPLATARFRDLFVVILLVYPSLSGRAMEFFRCREVEGEQYLMADYSVECYNSKWFAFLPLVVGVLVCPLASTVRFHRNELATLRESPGQCISGTA